MALFGEKCPICQMKVEKGKSLHRSGEYCSEEHVNQYMRKVEKEGKGGKWSSHAMDAADTIVVTTLDDSCSKIVYNFSQSRFRLSSYFAKILIT